jgi:alkanesulfonate monooxygenase SsuD/methylene tetrahydromethanopterin reductase-like flavin-dependent oxidoreductase (luciferase family)
MTTGEPVQFIANLMDPALDPSPWAAEREREGWSLLGASDHLFLTVGGSSQWFPHLWVTVSQMAAATSTVGLTSTFANNLLRSPVEFVQASFTMQRASHGRWEAGLGAGWSRWEIETTGLAFPEPRARAERYIEAVRVVRDLFDHHCCRFAGSYYTIEVPPMPGFDDVQSPPLVGALGGRRTIAGAGPWLDRVEIKASSSATRGGRMDPAAFARIPRSKLAELVDEVRRAAGDVEIAFYARCGVDDPLARHLASICTDPDGLYTGLFGPAAQVAERLQAFTEFGVTHVNVSPTHASAFERLAPHLFDTAAVRLDNDNDASSKRARSRRPIGGSVSRDACAHHENGE